MNIEKVSSTLNQAIAHLQAKELDEMYVGSGGTEGGGDGMDDGFGVDMSPDGDPDVGGEHGVDNYSSGDDVFDDYVEQIALQTSKSCRVSPSEVLGAIVDLAEQHAATGKLPTFPDLDVASPEELMAWAGAAKQLGFGGMLRAYCGG